MWGPNGPLVKRGLIAAPQKLRDRMLEAVQLGIALDPSELH